MVNYYLASAIFHGVSSSRRLRKVYRSLGNKKTNRPVTLGYTRWIWEQAAEDLATARLTFVARRTARYRRARGGVRNGWHRPIGRAPGPRSWP